jgi:DNA-directed RNA polymerase specialized sigma24 family protein
MPHSRRHSQRSRTPPPAGSPDPEQIGCLPSSPARISRRMTSSAHPIPQARLLHLPLVRWGSTGALLRAPGRRGAFNPEEAAHALKAQRAELRAALARRRDAYALTDGERDEVLDDAIATVVMSRKPIEDEQHLQGAFWASVGFLLARRRTGSHDLRVGSQRRVDFDPVERELPDGGEPFDVVAARDRITRAGDFIAQLDDLERQVLTVMAAYGLGVKATAKALDLPIKTVLAAARSGDRKLEQVAAIAAAGRMCQYRHHAIRAHAEGTALVQESHIAKAHLAACGSCRAKHAQLLREMSSREFKRAASAALLPAPIALPEAHTWIDRLISLVPGGHGPTGSAAAERAGALLGGGAGLKAITVTSVAVIAGLSYGAHVISSHPTHRPAHRHHSAGAEAHRPGPRAAYQQALEHPSVGSYNAPASRPVSHHKRGRSVARPPSRSLGYLAIGQPVSGETQPQARVSSTGSIAPQTTPPRPTASGGRTSLNYLGH